LARHGDGAWWRRGASSWSNGHVRSRHECSNSNFRAPGRPNIDRSCWRHRIADRDTDGDTDGNAHASPDRDAHASPDGNPDAGTTDADAHCLPTRHHRLRRGLPRSAD
jgi:hypothetical protein